VLPAVEFNHQPPFKAAEIDDIRSDPVLTSEFCAELPTAQSHPELQLGPCLIPPQLPRAAEPRKPASQRSQHNSHYTSLAATSF